MYLFSTTSLPPDVLDRYDRARARQVLTGQELSSPFAAGNMYHIDGADRVILADGSLFVIHTDPDWKAINKNPPICRSDTHTGIREWYKAFSGVCMENGVYIHPLWCFRRDHGGIRGFTVGDDTNDDLPQRLSLSIDYSASDLHRVLLHPSLFPKDSRLVDIIYQCNNDGYHALKQILYQSHPAFHPRPSTLITRYPKQGSQQSLLQYYVIFQDFLQLQAYVRNYARSLDDDGELDVFIHHTYHHEFLSRKTQEERPLSAHHHRYTATQILGTLQGFLNSPDSPTSRLRAINSPTPVRRPPRHRPRPPAAVRVHHLGMAPPTDVTTSDDSQDSIHDLCLSINAIDVGDSPSDNEVKHVYGACIHRIMSQPQQAFDKPCLVCHGSHTFANCPILQNHDFLKSHYIRFCGLLKRDTQARDSPPNRSSSPTPLRFIGSDHLSPSDDDSDGDLDFQMGRP